MNLTASGPKLLPLSGVGKDSTRENRKGVVLGLLALSLIAAASLVIFVVAGLTDGSQVDASAGGPQYWGNLSETYAPIDATIAGIGSDCCSHVSEYQFEPEVLDAASGR